MNSQKSPQAAFTLIELMAAVTIIGILLSVAIPNYSQYTMKAKMSEAYTLMDAVRKVQKVSYYENGYFWSTTSSSGNISEIDRWAQGGKMLFQYAQPGGQLLVADNTYSYFLINSLAGDYDADGNESNLPTDAQCNSTDVFVISASGDGDAICVGGTPEFTTLRGTDFGLVENPTGRYSFVITRAMARLSGGSTGFLDVLNKKCTAMVQVMQVDQSGEMVESPIIHITVNQ